MGRFWRTEISARCGGGCEGRVGPATCAATRVRMTAMPPTSNSKQSAEGGHGKQLGGRQGTVGGWTAGGRLKKWASVVDLPARRCRGFVRDGYLPCLVPRLGPAQRKKAWAWSCPKEKRRPGLGPAQRKKEGRALSPRSHSQPTMFCHGCRPVDSRRPQLPVFFYTGPAGDATW